MAEKEIMNTTVVELVGSKNQGDSNADRLERKQYEYRCIIRLKESRSTFFDQVLTNYLLFMKAEGYALSLHEQKLSIPVFRSFRKLIECGMQNCAQIKEALDGINVMIRVDPEGRNFWLHIGQLTSSLVLLSDVFCQNSVKKRILELDQSVIFKGIHPCMKKTLEKYLDKKFEESTLNGNIADDRSLSYVLLMAEHAALRRYPFFKEIKENLAVTISSRWLEQFEKKRMPSYNYLYQKYDLQAKAEDTENHSSSIKVQSKEYMKASMMHANELLSSWNIRLQVQADQRLLLAFPSAERSSGISPEYVARASQGIEWNNYNRTHFDIDNPPPAVDNAYYFDVCYANLPPRSRVKFEKFPSEKGWEDSECFLKIYVERTYDSLTFKIRNAPINTNPHENYRCEFQNGIFSLYFNLKPLRYTRI